jgi:putative PIN family toxin of toxin-antitoxin system
LCAVVDVNVVISALLSRDGSPAAVLQAWQQGRFELIVSPLLLEELGRALGYPKLRRRIPVEDAEAVVDWLGRAASLVSDPGDAPPVRSVDPGDDYLLALAASESAMLVSGDDHLRSLRGSAPVCSPAEFLELLERTSP